jgi:hypothetical protein
VGAAAAALPTVAGEPSLPSRRGRPIDLLVPPDAQVVVIALFAGDKKAIGDVWYDSVGGRADAIIDQWKREVGYGR